MEPLRVLFVDDEEELVGTVVERLGYRGIAAVGALSGAEALQLVRTQAFDVMVLDVKMPGLSGFEVLRTVQAERPGLPVVFLTGHGAAEDAEEGLRMGAFDYLMKPIKIDALVAILRKAAHR
jgi:two-component system OmpR family response regulator